MPTLKNNTIIQNKREDRQSVTSSSWVRLTNPWKLFKPNKPPRQLRFWEFKILRWFTIINYSIHFKIHFKIMYSISLIFNKDTYQDGFYVVILIDAQSFSSGTDRRLQQDSWLKNNPSDVKILKMRRLICKFFPATLTI